MEPKQRVRLLRRLRKSRNRAEHREKTWADHVQQNRRKWSKRAMAILWAHKMWKAHRNAPPSTSGIERAFHSEGEQATPEMLNWARRMSGNRYKAQRRVGKSFADYIQTSMRRPGFARQILNPTT